MEINEYRPDRRSFSRYSTGRALAPSRRRAPIAKTAPDPDTEASPESRPAVTDPMGTDTLHADDTPADNEAAVIRPPSILPGHSRRPSGELLPNVAEGWKADIGVVGFGDGRKS